MRHRIFVIVSITAWAELLGERIARVAEFEVVGSAPDAASALVTLQCVDPAPAIVMIDVGTPDGLENAAALRGSDGKRLVAVGLDKDPVQAIAWAVAGADGLVERTASLDEMLSTLWQVACGEARCSAGMSGVLLRGISGKDGSRDSLSTTHLTGREQEVAWLVARGLTNKEIATRLQIEPGTVKSHVHSVIRKLGVNRRIQVANRFHSNGPPS